MSQPNPVPALPRWLSVSIVLLLTAQVGLLWVHGSMLQRQHEDIQALRDDVQNLAEDLYEDEDGWDSNDDDPSPRPAHAAWTRHHPRTASRRGRRAVPAAYLQAQGEGDEETRKELDSTRQSGKDAVAQARKVQGQLSWTENARKAEEKARMEDAGHTWVTWLWVATGAAVAALAVRSFLRRRG